MGWRVPCLARVGRGNSGYQSFNQYQTIVRCIGLSTEAWFTAKSAHKFPTKIGGGHRIPTYNRKGSRKLPILRNTEGPNRTKPSISVCRPLISLVEEKTQTACWQASLQLRSHGLVECSHQQILEPYQDLSPFKAFAWILCIVAMAIVLSDHLRYSWSHLVANLRVRIYLTALWHTFFQSKTCQKQ